MQFAFLKALKTIIYCEYTFGKDSKIPFSSLICDFFDIGYAEHYGSKANFSRWKSEHIDRF